MCVVTAMICCVTNIVVCPFSNDFVKTKFHLVDLAGSERAKKTMAQGDRFNEGLSRVEVKRK